MNRARGSYMCRRDTRAVRQVQDGLRCTLCATILRRFWNKAGADPPVEKGWPEQRGALWFEDDPVNSLSPATSCQGHD